MDVFMVHAGKFIILTMLELLFDLLKLFSGFRLFFSSLVVINNVGKSQSN